MLEFTVDQSALKSELGHISGIMERKSTIPVLSSLLFESIDESTLRIVGTDLDCTLVTTVKANIKTEGSVCVGGRKLFDIVRNLSGEISFKEDDNSWMKIKSARSTFRIAGYPKDAFPEIPSPPKTIGLPYEMPADVLDHMFTRVSFAITNETSRFTLSGAKFMVKEGSVTAVATDGRRLAYIDKAISAKSSNAFDVLVPKKAITNLGRLLRDGGPSVSFGDNPHYIFFETGGRLLAARKLTGNFPNYEMVMPKDNDRRATFDWSEMKSAVRRVALFSDARTRSVKMNVCAGELELSAASSEEGEGNETVTCEYTGDETLLGFNPQYLQEFLNICGTGTEVEPEEGEEKNPNIRVAFEFKDANAATQYSVVGETGYDYRYVVMPLRV